MIRIDASAAILALAIVWLGGCGKPQQPVAAPVPPPAAPTPVGARSETFDRSSPSAFTTSVVEVLKGRDPAGGWSIRSPLTLVNTRALVVNLDRMWELCKDAGSQCEAEVAHFLDEALKISTRAAEPPATAQQLMAIVRPVSYLDQVPEKGRSGMLYESLPGDLLALYVVDQGGAVRGLKNEDLPAIGVNREVLSSTVRENLTAALPTSAELRVCEPHTVALWATGNYYESSRLLLSDFWTALAASAHGAVVVVVPTSDQLVVACAPDRAELKKLAGFVEIMSRKGQRPLSTSLLEWTAGGWHELRP
jgi:uncharacterized protein YtpQ (UPF0354 family)